MITTENYTSLITSSHKNKTKFKSVVEANTKFFAHLQNVLSSMINLFDVDLAVGDQLDKIGLWVGLSRYVSTPLTNVYFAWETASVGWNKGIWQGEFSPTSGLTTLPDDVYRSFLKAKIAANRWDGTIPHAYEIWETVFTNNTIVIEDQQDMSMVIAIVGEQLDALTQALITGGYIPLKPEGVQVAYYAIPVNDGPIFVWNGEGTTEETAGWDVGSWAEIIAPT